MVEAKTTPRWALFITRAKPYTGTITPLSSRALVLNVSRVAFPTRVRLSLCSHKHTPRNSPLQSHPRLPPISPWLHLHPSGSSWQTRHLGIPGTTAIVHAPRIERTYAAHLCHSLSNIDTMTEHQCASHSWYTGGSSMPALKISRVIVEATCLLRSACIL